MQPLVDLLAQAENLLQTPHPSSLKQLLRLATDLSDVAEMLHGRGALTSEEASQFDAAMSYSRELQDRFHDLEAADQAAARQSTLDSARNNRPTPLRATSTWQPATNGSSVALVSPRSRLDPSAGFRSLGEFLTALVQAASPGAYVDDRLPPLRADMSGASGPTGGFAVPTSYSNQLLTSLLTGQESLLARTSVYPLTEGDTLVLPAPTTSSRATGSRYGGVISRWISEGEQLTTSNPTLRQVRLSFNELATLIYVNDRLLRNAPALENYVSSAAMEDQTFMTNEGIVRGSGVGQPLGILNSAALIVVPEESAQASNLVLENINNMYARLLPQARRGALWLYHSSVIPALEALNISLGGTTGWPVYLPANSGVASIAGTPIPTGPNPMLKGLPMVECEQCSELGTVGDLILCNLQWVASIVRGPITDSSIHARFEFAQTGFRFRLDVDCEPVLEGPVTPAHGSLTQSAYIALAARV